MKKLLGTAASALVLAMALGFAVPAVADATPLDASIVRDPTEVPAPIIRSAPATVKIELEAVERVAELNDGSTYRFWTFNNQVPGPLTRVRVGDTDEVTLTKDEVSWMGHNKKRKRDGEGKGGTVRGISGWLRERKQKNKENIIEQHKEK